MSVLSLAREQRRQQATLGDLLVREIRELLRLLLGGRPPRPADTPDLVAVLAPLIQQYGRASASVAEDFYLRQRAEAGHTSPFAVPIAEPAPTEQIEKMVGWAARDRSREQAEAREQLRELRERRERAIAAAEQAAQTQVIDLDDPAQVDQARALSDMEGAARRMAAQPGRKTLEDAIDDDPEAVAWVRVTDGNPCGFCAMLAARGAVFLSRESALYRDGTRDPFHDSCGCVAAPRFRDSVEPLPAENQAFQDLWYAGPAYFSNEDARNAMDRAVRAQRAGRDVKAAVFDGYEHRVTHDRATVEEFRRKAQRGGRNGKRPAARDSAGDPRFGR